MKRRAFLKASVVTVGSVLLGAACGGDDSDGDDPNLDADTGDDVNPDGSDPDVGPDVEPDATEEPELEDGTAFFPQSLASGDPKPDSVILWTRVSDSDTSGDLELKLQLALDETFTEVLELDGGSSMTLAAEAAFDHCVKVRLTGLDAATVFWYRFIYEKDGSSYVSRTGRTKTAPEPDADVMVRFAYTSCQDYNGRYYNPYKRMNQLELDFMIHLGDYIYETTGNPQFQEPTEDRRVVFEDEAGAIVFHEGEEDQYFAARSLSNYRTLYKTYRSDPHLQRMHELIPMIATWDDHEFTNDCWQDRATYYGGREDEQDTERRQNASQAWFEYMPVDYLDDPDFRYDSEVAFPNDIKIYRDFRFGRHVHLVMTDLRSYRTDHLIHEDAFPGAIAVNQAQFEALGLDELPEFFSPYIPDIETYEDGIYKTFLDGFANDENEWDTNLIIGEISVGFINAYAEQANADEEIIPLIDDETLPLGLSFQELGKNSQYTSIGSRDLVIDAAYNVYADALYQESGGTSESAMGEEQETWFGSVMQNSDATWKVWGNSNMITQMKIDLSDMSVNESFQKKFLMSAEDWSGMPNASDRILTTLESVENVVAVTGDRHAFFAATPHVRNDPDTRIVEFTASAISSTTYRTMLVNTADSDPALAAAGAAMLGSIIGDLILDPGKAPSPHIGHASPDQHGFGVVEANGDELLNTYYEIEYQKAKEELDGNAADFAEQFSMPLFRVLPGTNNMQKQIDGVWNNWNQALPGWEPAT